jgi:hypothetical protein
MDGERNLTEEDDSRRVVQLNIQMFPLTIDEG